MTTPAQLMRRIVLWILLWILDAGSLIANWADFSHFRRGLYLLVVLGVPVIIAKRIREWIALRRNQPMENQSA
ncbi:MAG: hypothetical protein ABI142_04805 [Bryocella sp.]